MATPTAPATAAQTHETTPLVGSLAVDSGSGETPYPVALITPRTFPLHAVVERWSSAKTVYRTPGTKSKWQSPPDTEVATVTVRPATPLYRVSTWNSTTAVSENGVVMETTRPVNSNAA